MFYVYHSVLIQQSFMQKCFCHSLLCKAARFFFQISIHLFPGWPFVLSLCVQRTMCRWISGWRPRCYHTLSSLPFRSAHSKLTPRSWTSTSATFLSTCTCKSPLLNLCFFCLSCAHLGHAHRLSYFAFAVPVSRPSFAVWCTTSICSAPMNRKASSPSPGRLVPFHILLLFLHTRPIP